jgi:hypothetical protein
MGPFSSVKNYFFLANKNPAAMATIVVVTKVAVAIMGETAEEALLVRVPPFFILSYSIMQALCAPLLS